MSVPVGMRFLKPVIERAGDASDLAKNGYPLGSLKAVLSDCAGQPDWRRRADIAHAYYDIGKQLSEEKLQKIRWEMNIEPRQTNLIHGVVNGVLGQEAKQRSDVMVAADDEDFQDIADVGSAKMEEARRESYADMAISNAYASQVKGGLGWVEVSRATDPLDPPYRVKDVHRREIYWDWRTTDIGLESAAWLVRKRWHDLDEAVAMMPQFRDVLMHSVSNDWSLLDFSDENSFISQRTMATAWRAEREFSTTMRRDEWMDSDRRRIKFYEVWYRVPAEAVVIQTSPTRRLLYNPNNQVHVQAVARGAKVFKTVTRQMRMALFAGPHRLIDTATNRRHFPYIPFFAFRDDEDRSPYGLIEGMISPQDSYNERRQMVDWMLKARQTYIDNDALDTEYNTIADVRRTSNRPDFSAVLNATRRNANGVRVEAQFQLQREQLDVMMNDKQAIQDVPRIYSTQLGDAPTGVTSGVAINSLTEAGAVAMGELNDNYRFGRQRVHEQLLDLIFEDHLAEDLQVRIGNGQNRRTVVLNTWTQEGAPLNRVEDAPLSIGLGDIPSSPAFRMQEQQQLATMIQALQANPAAMNILAPAYLEGGSHPNRKQMADDLRRATGQPVAGDRQAQQAAQQQQEQERAKAAALAEAKAIADIAETRSKTDLNNAKAGIERAKETQIGFDIGTAATTPPEQAERDPIEDSISEAMTA